MSTLRGGTMLRTVLAAVGLMLATASAQAQCRSCGMDTMGGFCTMSVSGSAQCHETGEFYTTCNLGGGSCGWASLDLQLDGSLRLATHRASTSTWLGANGFQYKLSCGGAVVERRYSHEVRTGMRQLLSHIAI